MGRLATNVLWTFALGGKAQEAAASPPPLTESTFGGRVVKATAVTLGGMIGDGGLVDKIREVPDEYSTLPMRIRVHVGDTVIWDNRGVLHRAAPYDPDAPREMLRTTVLGDEPIQ